jgi:hypothetical protein
MFSEIAGKGRGKFKPDGIYQQNADEENQPKFRVEKTEWKYWDSDTFLYLCS